MTIIEREREREREVTQGNGSHKRSNGDNGENGSTFALL
jgi:hypothetical protein